VPKVGIGYVVVQIIRHLDSLGLAIIYLWFLYFKQFFFGVSRSTVFSFLAKFRKIFDLKNYGFNLYTKGKKNSWEKWGQIRQISKKK
jgi:hypothetical protein